VWKFTTGGHNLLLLAQDVGQYIQLGTTVDDAIGEVRGKFPSSFLGFICTETGFEDLGIE
jgi:tRNA A37 threonylcarbamoyltransferase TsaD